MCHTFKDREFAGLKIHHVNPLSILQSVIPTRQWSNAIESCITLFPIDLSVTRKLRIQELPVHLVGGLYGIFYQLHIGILPVGRKLGLNFFDYGRQSSIIFQAFTNGLFTPRQVFYFLINRVTFFFTRIPHKLRLADIGQAVMFLHHRKQSLCVFRTKLSAQPVLQMSCNTFFSHLFYIPRHIEE